MTVDAVVQELPIEVLRSSIQNRWGCSQLQLAAIAPIESLRFLTEVLSLTELCDSVVIAADPLSMIVFSNCWCL